MPELSPIERSTRLHLDDGQEVIPPEQAASPTVGRYTEIQAEILRRQLRRFVKDAWMVLEPGRPLKWGWHLDMLCDFLTYVVLGDIRRIVINVPPRTTKSTVVSVCLPAWVWTDQPEIQWLFSSYAERLSLRDSVKCRRIIQSKWYQERFGNVFTLVADQNAKIRYDNSEGGYRIATSVDGANTGEGGDIIVVDDPNNVKEVTSDVIRESVNDWWDNVMVSRFNDAKTGRVIMIAQRSHDSDLCGHILSKNSNYVHLMLPMEFDANRKCSILLPNGIRMEDPRTRDGELLCPDRIGPEELDTLKSEMTEREYQTQFQQDPEAGGGLILKRDWWRPWQEAEAPPCIEVIQCYDTAFEEKEEADYSARTSWGVFLYSETGDPADEQLNLVMLESWQHQVGFPELRKEAKESYLVYHPDKVLVEKKASGHSLIQELRSAGLKGIRAVKVRGDKVARAHYASLMLEQGRVWYMPRQWALSVISQCSKFPLVEHDDLVDTVTIALSYLRSRGQIELPTDERDDLDLWQTHRRGAKSYGAGRAY